MSLQLLNILVSSWELVALREEVELVALREEGLFPDEGGVGEAEDCVDGNVPCQSGQGLDKVGVLVKLATRLNMHLDPSNVHFSKHDVDRLLLFV